MFDYLKEKGIIILHNGCLETSMEDLNIGYTKNKVLWLENAMKTINSLSKKELQISYIFRLIFE